MRLKIRHAITSARRTFPVCFDRHARRFHLLEEVIAFGVWLERREELEEDIVELYTTRTTAKNIGHTFEIVKVC